MEHVLKSSKQSGFFTLSSGKELYGELRLTGPKSSLKLFGTTEFLETELHGTISGVLHDLTKVSLLQCIPRFSSRVSRPTDDDHHASVFHAKVFPHFVVLGHSHIQPEEPISGVDFLIDDAHILFYDFDAFGSVNKATRFIDGIANANMTDRRIAVGPDAEILYFTGKREIFTAATALGTVSALHSPSLSLSAARGVALTNKIFVSIAFESWCKFQDAMNHAYRLVEYFGLIVGRPQKLVRCNVQVASQTENPINVYWCMPPTRDASSRSREPHAADVLLRPVEDPEHCAHILRNWLERQTDWRDARSRFFNSFSKQQLYGLDRLIGSANMFDVLPASAVPRDVQLTDELRSARSSSRKLFRALPASPERDSILAALGRLGKSTLKQKVRHRVLQIVESSGGWFPELSMITDEAVNCRNYYVHGGEARFDYNKNFGAVVFFTQTLEFVFAASDLIEAGWDIRSWLTRGTTRSHPFGAYRVDYPAALEHLKALLTPRSDS